MITYEIAPSELGYDELSVVFVGQDNVEHVTQIPLLDFYKEKNFLGTINAQVNAYLNTLPIEVQGNVYAIFEIINKTGFTPKAENPGYSKWLEERIADLVTLLDYDNFKRWSSQLEEGMNIHESVLTDYVFDPDMGTTREKTYVKSEYRDLISFILFMRVLAPAYIEMYNYTKTVSDYYQYETLSVLARSTLYDCPELNKLREYVDVNEKTLITAKKREQSVVVTPLSYDDIVENLVSEIIFNKLISIDFFNKKCNIISYIFTTIRHKGNYSPNDSITMVREHDSVGTSYADDISVMEDQRRTSNITVGAIAELQHSLSNKSVILNRLGYLNFDYEAYERELKHTKIYMDNLVSPIQIHLLGWFLNKVINPRALEHIELYTIVEYMLLAKIALIQYGHPYIGMILGSYKENYSNMVPSVNIRGSLNKDTIRKLTEVYPFFIEEGEKSVIEETIIEAARELVINAWRPVIVPEHLSDMINRDGLIKPPSENITNVLFEYVLFVNKQQNVTY